MLRIATLSVSVSRLSPARWHIGQGAGVATLCQCQFLLRYGISVMYGVGARIGCDVAMVTVSDVCCDVALVPEAVAARVLVPVA